jgi:catechol 2,3-dioxygenase-like lactoylglutathione lyase family enzyme
MPVLHSAVPVLQVADVARSARWYRDILGFAPDFFPDQPPHTFAILRRDGAELMLQCAEQGGGARPPDPEFLWSVYLRVADGEVLPLSAKVAALTRLLRGPERMFYGLVEFELCDPDGYRISLGGTAPADAQVPVRSE